MSRTLATPLVLATLGTIGWYAYWVVPQTRMTPDSGRFVLLFFGGLALPYIITLGQLARSDGRDGLRLAFGAADVNALCTQPLRFRATGFSVVVGDGSTIFGAGGAGVPEHSTPDEPPTCASVLSIEREDCFVAARILAEGEGIAPDREKAFALFAQICDDGMALACTRAAAVAPGRAQDYLRRACVLGEANACAAPGK